MIPISVSENPQNYWIVNYIQLINKCYARRMLIGGQTIINDRPLGLYSHGALHAKSARNQPNQAILLVTQPSNSPERGGGWEIIPVILWVLTHRYGNHFRFHKSIS